MVFDIGELTFADHVHDLDASDQDSGAAESLETEHRAHDALDGPMVLLDDVVEVLRARALASECGALAQVQSARSSLSSRVSAREGLPHAARVSKRTLAS